MTINERTKVIVFFEIKEIFIHLHIKIIIIESYKIISNES